MNVTNELFLKLRSLCDKYLKSDMPKPKSSGWCRYLYAARKAQVQMIQCALMFLLTEDKSYLDRVRAVVKTVLSWDNWIDPDHMKPGVHSDLMTAEIAIGLAIIYDWLYDYLPQDELSEIRRALSERAASQIYADSRAGIWWASSDGYSSNWCGVMHGGLGLAGLALLGEVPEAKFWIIQAKEKILAFLNSGDPDGAWSEGVSYWEYGIGHAVLFIEALRRVTGEDLYKHPYLKASCLFPVYAIMPDFSGQVNFADSSYEGITRLIWLLFRLSSEYRNPYSQWTTLKILEMRGSNSWRTHWEFLWFDHTLKPICPEGHLPNSKVFHGAR